MTKGAPSKAAQKKPSKPGGGLFDAFRSPAKRGAL